MSEQDKQTVERIRKNIGDRQIIRMVPPVEAEIQTSDEQALVDVLRIVDSLALEIERLQTEIKDLKRLRG